FRFGLKELAEPIRLIEEVRAAVGKEKRDLVTPKNDAERAKKEARERVEALARPFLAAAIKDLFFSTPHASKVERAAQKKEVKKRLEAHLAGQGVASEEIGYGTSIVTDVLEEEVMLAILNEGRRVDGRGIE